MKTITTLWIFLVVLVLLTPLGLFLPEHFGAGAAWGEWGVEEMQELVGYIPQGLARFAAIWHAPMPDYAITGWEEAGLPRLSIAYILSAVTGIAITVFVVFLIGKILVKRKD